MISAKDAHITAKTISTKQYKDELGKIELKIKTAADNGYFECFYYGNISNKNLLELSTLGYNITNSTDPRDGGEHTYTIKW